MDKRVLFLTLDVPKDTGGGIFTDSIKEAIKKNTISFSEIIFPYYRNSRDKLYHSLLGYTGGLRKDLERSVIHSIESNSIDVVFFNGSLYGRLIEMIKCRYPSVKCICLFHNIEYSFVKNALQRLKHIGGLLTLWVTYRNERKSVRFSDIKICLNERDSIDLHSIYGEYANVICPLCLPDRFNENRIEKAFGGSEIVGAFIGSKFYPNCIGVSWFAKNVAPYVKAKILVIGKGMEDLREELESYSQNIKVIGTVDSLDDYYYQLDFVVSPIFDGSGMKTKTAEALMFGKTIFGTSEAFEGYKIENYEAIGALCNTVTEFITSINRFQRKTNKFNPESRALYLANYSDKTLLNTLLKVLEV